jgi:hypothetical protein
VVTVQAGDVVVDRLRRDRQRDVQDAGVLLQLAVRHVGVGRADLHETLDRLRDAGARAGALGRHADARMRLLEMRHPDVEQRVEQRGAGLGQRDGLRGRGDAGADAGDEQRRGAGAQKDGAPKFVV